MLILETLSTNRDLKERLKEAEEMLRDIKYEELPSYEIGMERGFSKGVDYGVSQGMMETAIKMIKEFNLSIDAVAKKLDISIDELKRHLQK